MHPPSKMTKILKKIQVQKNKFRFLFLLKCLKKRLFSIFVVKKKNSNFDGIQKISFVKVKKHIHYKGNMNIQTRFQLHNDQNALVYQQPLSHRKYLANISEYLFISRKKGIDFCLL